MITERQKAFRQEYRSRIVGWYDGYVHIVIIYAIGAAAFYVYVAHIHDVTWLEWLTLPLTFLIAAVALWFVGIETKGKVLEQITAGEAGA